jgi:hypothetical protein
MSKRLADKLAVGAAVVAGGPSEKAVVKVIMSQLIMCWLHALFCFTNIFCLRRFIL